MIIEKRGLKQAGLYWHNLHNLKICHHLVANCSSNSYSLVSTDNILKKEHSAIGRMRRKKRACTLYCTFIFYQEMYLLSNLESQQFGIEFCSFIHDQLLLATKHGLASFQVPSTISQCQITRDINIWFHGLLSDLVLTAGIRMDYKGPGGLRVAKHSK